MNMTRTLTMIADTIKTTVTAYGPVWTVSVILMYVIPYIYFITKDDLGERACSYGLKWLALTMPFALLLIGILSFLGHDFGRCLAHGAYVFTLSMFINMGKERLKRPNNT